MRYKELFGNKSGEEKLDRHQGGDLAKLGAPASIRAASDVQQGPPLVHLGSISETCFSKMSSNTTVLPPTEGRVPHQSYEKHNQAITEATIRHLEKWAYEGNPETVTNRLATLAKEWDMERTLEMNASIAATTGLLFGVFVHSRWFLFSFIVLAFLFQHALQGYCPPMVWFRAYGWRTGGEIEDEAMALRLLHGRVVPGLAQAVKKIDKERLLEEMEKNKRENGRFVGERPNTITSHAVQKEE